MCAGSMALHPYHRVSATIGGVDSYSTYTGRNHANCLLQCYTQAPPLGARLA